METNKKPTILIYTGDCAELAKLFEIEKNKKVLKRGLKNYYIQCKNGDIIQLSSNAIINQVEYFMEVIYLALME